MARPTKPSNPVDIHVGSRLRKRRRMLGVSQEKLGEALGLTFQQIQKYEKGINRIGASRLQQAAEILGVTVPFFFEGGTDGRTKVLCRPPTSMISSRVQKGRDSPRRSCKYHDPQCDCALLRS
jgi:DNA-binding XRE family transcriptional regulator